MRYVKFLPLILVPLLLISQDADEKRFQQIKAKRDRGETITTEERNFSMSVMERKNQANAASRNAEYVRLHPPKDSIGIVPLNDLGRGKYKEVIGGLYGNGLNVPPRPHRRAGLELAKKIRALDSTGNPSPAGKIVLMSVGMSNATQETRAFQALVEQRKSELHPQLVVVDSAQGAQTAAVTAKPDSNYWNVAEDRLREAQVTAAQVQLIWLKQANAGPREEFPIESNKLKADLLSTVHNLKAKYPNVKMIFLSSRIYAGYAVTPLNPEPHAFETAFAVRSLIQDQIAGNAELNYDPSKGAVRAPWLAWGPYLWADGVKGRKDGVTWAREDLGPDGTHPSYKGQGKVAAMLFDFFRSSEFSKSWFLKPQ